MARKRYNEKNKLKIINLMNIFYISKSIDKIILNILIDI